MQGPHREDAVTRFVRVVPDAVHGCVYSVRVFLASRAEPHLNAAFRKPCVSDCLHTISLDDSFAPPANIRRFVRASFVRIRMTHHLSHTGDRAWPPRPGVESIVSRSSGQFIFASVAMHFITIPGAGPATQLAIVRGLSPFSPLNALYEHILA